MRRAAFTLALLGLSGAFCTGPEQMREATLAKFTSAEEMLNYLSDQVAREADSRQGYLEDGSVNDMVGMNTSGGGGDSFSTTNIQEAGVDESDVVKNDGTFIYLLRSDSLRIVRAVPADTLAEVGGVDLEGWVDSFYLAGDRVVALGSLSGAQGTIVTLIDVTDRSQPAIQQTWQFEARLAASRLIGDKLHLVLTATPPVTYDSNRAPVPWGSLDPVIPGYQVAAGGETIRQGKMAEWSNFYHPMDAQGYGLTIVTTINLADLPAEPQSAGITANAGVVYASPSSLYVTSPQYGWWYDRLTDDRTTVHKFDLTGDRAVYIGGGEVPGHLLNQYSLGEKDGYLRLGATTGHVSPDGNSTAVNAVYVLDKRAIDGKLNIVGKVEDIAPGEQIYSARFIGSRGFLVTFKKVDPLYTLDMSDPANPRVVGQLKVPGYSDYIHPMDADHLLAIGKDAYDMGDFAWYQGVQLSIFDVTDFANPQLLAKEIIGVRGTESDANYNPKAFNYYVPQNALAIPIHLAEGPTQQPNESGHYTFGGLYVYHAAIEDGFSLLGRISTTSDQQSYWSSGRYTRGIFIGDSVYAVSESTVIAAPIADPSQIQSSVSLQ